MNQKMSRTDFSSLSLPLNSKKQGTIRPSDNNKRTKNDEVSHKNDKKRHDSFWFAVATEVYKKTPYGERFIDIEVSQNGTILGGIETKAADSPHGMLQHLKDLWLKYNKGYPVTIIRIIK